MNPNDIIRLLILNDSRTEAERLISMLHNAGRPSRAQHVESDENLAKLLQEQTWDMLIGHDKTSNVTPADAIKQIRRLNKDIPVILLTDDDTTQSIVEGIKAGAADVVRLDEDQHLLQVIQRELMNREQRQQKRSADRRFREAERRSQQLLDSSRDAIAYMQDGLYLYANESFADLFGYEDKDDIECMPIMDMVAESDQPTLKKFLKNFTLKGDEAESTRLEFKGVRRDGGNTQISLEVAQATYDEEPCIQFLARAGASGDQNNEVLEAQIKQIKWQDIATGLHNRHYMIDRLEKTIANIQGNQTFGLLYIDIDNFAERIQSSLGVAGSDLALANIATLLKEKAGAQAVAARFGDTSFTLLIPDTTADSAVAFAENLCKTLEDHIVDVDGKTVQLTASIGVSLLTENSTSAETVIDQAIKAMEQARGDKGNAALLFEPELSADEREERDMIAEVKNALDKDGFRLLFQPIISLRGSEEECYEALLRLVSESGEEISPDRFMEAAGNIGVTIKIDRWVILESFKMLAKHRSKGHKTRLIVNLSRESLCDEALLPWLGVAFKAAKLPTDSIIFQVNEVDVTNHLNAAKAFAAGLKKMGTQLSISNFGCALNPFNTLKHVEADMIKIDGSFTLDIQNNNENPETMTNLIEKLHEAQKVTLVPFVENASVLSTLWQAGVHYIQGNYLQEPSESMSYEFNMET